MTGGMPYLHLNRGGPIRLLENIQKHALGLRLSNSINEPQKKSYAEETCQNHQPSINEINVKEGNPIIGRTTARDCYNITGEKVTTVTHSPNLSMTRNFLVFNVENLDISRSSAKPDARTQAKMCVPRVSPLLTPGMTLDHAWQAQVKHKYVRTVIIRLDIMKL